MNLLISVIVPIYNAKSTLQRCVDSLLNQTYNNLEIILVDDGSSDGSELICEIYAKKYSNVRTIHQRNSGPAVARNKGIEAAHGEFLGFVDSDDYTYPQMFEHLYFAVKNTNTKLSICSFDCVDKDDNSIQQFYDVNPIPDGIYSAEEILPKVPLNWAYVVPWNKLYHKSLLNKIHFPEGKYYEDEYIIAPVIYTAGYVSCISSREYHYYYMREGSQTEGSPVITQLDALEALYNRCMFYHAHGLDNLIYDNRTIMFRELEKHFTQLDKKDPEIRARLKQISDWYGKIPGRGWNETIRWYLLRIAPKLERKIMKILHPNAE